MAPRLIRTALLSALVVVLAVGTFTIFGAQEPEPDAPATPATGNAPTGLAANTAVQPIAFSHAHHVTEVGVDCQFCHAYARRGPIAGIPSVQSCVGCHQVVLNEQPEILKVLEYWENEVPIPSSSDVVSSRVPNDTSPMAARPHHFISEPDTGASPLPREAVALQSRSWERRNP